MPVGSEDRTNCLIYPKCKTPKSRALGFHLLSIVLFNYLATHQDNTSQQIHRTSITQPKKPIKYPQENNIKSISCIPKDENEKIPPVDESSIQVYYKGNLVLKKKVLLEGDKCMKLEIVDYIKELVC